MQLTATFHLKNTKDWHGEKEFINCRGGVLKSPLLILKLLKEIPNLQKATLVKSLLCVYINAKEVHDFMLIFCVNMDNDMVSFLPL